MFIKQDEVFEFGGLKLRAKRAPKKGWPCQMCALAGQCDTDRYAEDAFPQCRWMDREDKVSVVFTEQQDAPAPRRKGGRG